VRIESQRDWVRGHFEAAAQHKYAILAEKLRLLQTILDAEWIERHETFKLQCLGITLGDALCQELRMEWVMVEDDHGRDPALRLPGTTVIVFPLTMISKRVERGEIPNVAILFRGVVQDVREMAPEYRLDG
jgi:hypothetical protein